MKSASSLWYLAYDPDLNDTSLASLVTNPKLHALSCERATDGNIQCRYIPVDLAMIAPELLQSLEIATKELSDQFNLTEWSSEILKDQANKMILKFENLIAKGKESKTLLVS